jgi:hypothetical protein
MDDLTMLRQVRAAEPGPSAAETTAARNALMTAAEAAGRSWPGRRARLRSAVRRTAGRRVWVPVVAAAAAVAVAGGALMLAPGGSPHPASRSAAAHQAGPVPPVYKHAALTAAFVLDKAAAAAALQGSTTGKYFFTESEWISSGEFGSSPQVYRVGPYLRQHWFGNGADGRVVLAAGGSSRILPLTAPSSSGMSWAQLRSLPTAPGPLLAIVARLAADINPKYPDSLAFGEFEVIQQLLFENPVPPGVQAALYQLAAGLPGISVTDTTDLVGRPAVEVYMEPGPDDPPAVGQALYFSPVTFQQLGWATISAVSVSCPVLASSAVLASGYVSSDTQLPPGTPAQLEPAHYSNSAPGCPTFVPRAGSLLPTASSVPSGRAK